MLIDGPTNAIVAEGFSKSHSSRVAGDKVLLLDSGRGLLVEIDPVTAKRREIAFLPGFMRELPIHNFRNIRGRFGFFCQRRRQV